MEIRPFTSDDEAAVVQLWRECNLVVPHNDPHEDIRRKLTVQPELFLVGLIAGKPVATVMAGYDGHRGWLNYLAVAPERRRAGLGRQMVAEAEKRLRCLGCPKINLLRATLECDRDGLLPENRFCRRRPRLHGQTIGS